MYSSPAAADNGISVFTLNSSGILTNVFNFTDTVDTLVAGATASASRRSGPAPI